MYLEDDWSVREAGQEVNRFLSLLAEQGLTLEDLVINSPRRWKTREEAKRIAHLLAGDPELMNYIREHHHLPPITSLKKYGFDKKVLSRHSNYIIGVALIIADGLSIMGQLVTPWKGGDIFGQG